MTNPHGSCVDQGVATCGTNGFCDGAGSCQKYPVGAVCGDALCLVQQLMLASRCTVEGVCAAGGRQSCYPFLCDETGTSCRTSCADSSVCANGVICQNDVCGKKALGTACALAVDCDSGFCAQGVCCAELCTGRCLSCALKGSAGACTAVPSGMPPSSETTACPASNVSTCGQDGTCDGAGGCRLYPVGTACSAPSCSLATLRPSGACDVKHRCVVLPTLKCGGYTCATSTTCKNGCASDADCESPSVCRQGGCVVFEPDQLYRIEPFGNGTPTLSLDIPNSNQNLYPPVLQSTIAALDQQKFYLRRSGVGAFVIAMMDNQNACVDDPDGSNVNETKLRVSDCNSTDAQRWQITADPNIAGTYTIRNVAAGKCLDEYRGAQTLNLPMQIFDCQGNDHQRFFIKPAGGAGQL